MEPGEVRIDVLLSRRTPFHFKYKLYMVGNVSLPSDRGSILVANDEISS